MVVKFSDPIMRQVKLIRIEAARLRDLILKQEVAIKNSLHQLGEWAWQSKIRPILHAGIYIAALMIVIISLWFSVTYGIAMSLQVLGETIIERLKSGLPLIMSIVWLACRIYSLATSRDRLESIFSGIEGLLTKGQ